MWKIPEGSNYRNVTELPTSRTSCSMVCQGRNKIILYDTDIYHIISSAGMKSEIVIKVYRVYLQLMRRRGNFISYVSLQVDYLEKEFIY
jgi:hypothetical protein